MSRTRGGRSLRSALVRLIRRVIIDVSDEHLEDYEAQVKIIPAKQ
ncbi:MAG TPA: hypothetical protein VET27_09280 [Mycobacterium sp.]|nr:hypothetical protein [Mycobacterium sp.]